MTDTDAASIAAALAKIDAAAIARIDQRLSDMAESLKSVCAQVKEHTSRLDILETEHKARTTGATECNQTVNVPGTSISRLMLAAMTGGSGVVGAGIILIIILILKKEGWI